MRATSSLFIWECIGLHSGNSITQSVLRLNNAFQHKNHSLPSLRPSVTIYSHPRQTLASLERYLLGFATMMYIVSTRRWMRMCVSMCMREIVHANVLIPSHSHHWHQQISLQREPHHKKPHTTSTYQQDTLRATLRETHSQRYTWRESYTERDT